MNLHFLIFTVIGLQQVCVRHWLRERGIHPFNSLSYGFSTMEGVTASQPVYASCLLWQRAKHFCCSNWNVKILQKITGSFGDPAGISPTSPCKGTSWGFSEQTRQTLSWQYLVMDRTTSYEWFRKTRLAVQLMTVLGWHPFWLWHEKW